jgi:hypothetical protein
MDAVPKGVDIGAIEAFLGSQIGITECSQAPSGVV